MKESTFNRTCILTLPGSFHSRRQAIKNARRLGRHEGFRAPNKVHVRSLKVWVLYQSFCLLQKCQCVIERRH